jgi:hypothetical protein
MSFLKFKKKISVDAWTVDAKGAASHKKPQSAPPTSKLEYLSDSHTLLNIL